MPEPSESQRLDVLGRCAVFSSLDEAARRSVLRAGRTRRVKPGAVIFSSRQRAEAFYAILAGRVKVYKLSPRGDEQILHLYGAGETFGEAAVLSGGRYPAFAEAVEPALLLELRRVDLRRMLAARADLGMGMLAGLSAKLHEFAATIEDLSLKEVPARLAGALLAAADAAGADRFRLPQTKRQLAAQLGTVAETLSRALAKLKAAGFIDVKGAQITILDRPALRGIAAGEAPA